MTSPISDIAWLSDWFANQCDGDWEHEFGISVGTLDNPGWSLRIDLTRTDVSGRPFTSVEVEDQEGWMRLWKDDGESVFHGACSPTMLPAVLSLFRDWANGSASGGG